jgi:alkylhydroperoxidase family enzyme
MNAKNSEDFDPHRKVSRLPPLPRPLDPTIVALFEETKARGGDILNLHLTNAHAPRLSKAKRMLTFALRNDCDCPRLYREIAICRAAFLVGCQYEVNHHLPLVELAGLSGEQARGTVERQIRVELFDDKQRALLAYIDQVCENKGVVSDAAFAAMQSHFSSQEIVELTICATSYYASGLFMKALAITPDDPHKRAAPGKF